MDAVVPAGQVDRWNGVGSIAKGRKHECPVPIRLYDTERMRRLVLPCGARTCSWCGPNIWRRRVLAGLHAGLRSAPPDRYLAVLLTAPGDADAVEFNASASAKWHRFVEYLRRKHPGKQIEFWRVAELQERGHVHFHVVLRGLRHVRIAVLRECAVSAGFGSWVGVRSPKRYKGGTRSLGWYFGKYLLKHYSRAAIGVTKLVTFSNGWRSGWVRPVRLRQPGRWLYAGPDAAGWLMVGREVAPAREASERTERRRSSIPWPWYSPESWRVARSREELPIDGGFWPV